MIGSTKAIFWLKEFSKSWVNIMSDEVVYCEQISQREPSKVIGLNRRRTYIKEYLSSKLWLEILFKIRRLGNLEFYAALIESNETINKERAIRTGQASSNINFSRTWEDNTVLVNVVNPRENPQRVAPPFPIRSVIRLHRLNLIPDVFTKIFEPPLDEFKTFLIVDWEDSACSVLDSESPSDIVKGGTQTMSNLAYQKSPGYRELLCEIRPENITPILRVFIDSTSIRLTCSESPDFPVEDIKVFLRPVDSSEGVSHLLHRLYYPLNERL